MDKEKLDKIDSILQENFKQSYEELKDKTLEALLEEQSIDSLDLMNFIFDVENVFSIEIQTEDIDTKKTVGEFVDFLEQYNQ